MLRVHRDKDRLLKMIENLMRDSSIVEDDDNLRYHNATLDCSTFTSDWYTIYWSQY
jgi:hypothetical protein